MSAICGIYKITCTPTGRVYVGSSVNCRGRWEWEHRIQLRDGLHCNCHLQAAWHRYGESAFVFEVVEECPRELLLLQEELWIERLDAFTEGFNQCRVPSRTRLGTVHTEQTRKKMSLSAKGKKRGPYSEERRRAQSEGLKRYYQTRPSSARAASISLALQGRKLTQAHRKNISEGLKRWLQNENK